MHKYLFALTILFPNFLPGFLNFFLWPALVGAILNSGTLSLCQLCPPVVNVIKVTTAITNGRKASLMAVTSVLDVRKHFYGHNLRQQSHLAA